MLIAAPPVNIQLFFLSHESNVLFMRCCKWKAFSWLQELGEFMSLFARETENFSFRWKFDNRENEPSALS